MAWSGFRSAFKGTPQQGTMFDVRDVPSQPVDSPGIQKRGRRAEMMAALPPVQAGAGADSFDDVRSKIEQRRGSGNFQVLTARTRAETFEKSSLAERAGLARKIGNETTLAPSHFEGIGRVDVGTAAARDSGDTAEYLTATFEQPPRLMFRGSPQPSTIAHEVGHHVSLGHQGNKATVGVTQMARMSSGATLWPAEEARADAFMHQHTVGEPERSYAKLKGFPRATEYGSTRESLGVPLTAQEREWQGMPSRVLQPDLFGEQR